LTGSIAADYRSGGQAEAKHPRTGRSFLVPKAEIAGNDCGLCINR
jgi:hypothetical protein